MIGKTISHYKIIEKLGEGGMGVVYKAEDTKLKRIVALKFLPPELTRDPEAKKRFIHEAQAASSLQHNNICTIHEFDETEDEHLFICMDYYRGESLEDKIDRGPLKLEEAIDIAIQVTQGLAKAHEEGIVHRDIKPANLHVTNDNMTKILDFGLAKLRVKTKLTKEGTTLGTVAYMSPEQTRGEPVDHRTDIWSLGVVLYTMITGQLPFKGDHEQAVMYSIINEIQEPLTGLRTGVPMELERIVNKALLKKPDERYQHVDEMLVDLKNVFKSNESGTTEDQKVEVAPSRMRRGLIYSGFVGVIIIACLALYILLPRKSVPSDRKSIAVLPFKNLSGDKADDYFSDGISEDIITQVSKIGELRVISRTSTMHYKESTKSLREIGRELNVSTILEGSIRRADNRVRIVGQLVDARTDEHIWAETYDRDLSDIFAIQSDVAQQIARALKATLSPEERERIEQRPTDNLEAYDYYLRGRKFFWETRRRSLEFAREMFTRATQIDPGYALAYAGIADCYSWLYLYWESTEENIRDAEKASRKALELNPDLAEAHVARGHALSLSKRYQEAEREFEAAVQLNPRLFEAYYFYARSSFAEGNLKEAAKLFEKASKVRPEDYQTPLLLSAVYNGLGRKNDARIAQQRGLDFAEKHLRLNPDDVRALYLSAIALIGLGEQERGLERAQQALKIDPEEMAILYNVACVYSLAGKIEEAIDLLEKALKAGFAHKEWIENDSDLDPLRSHPRFQALLDQMK